MKKKAKKKNRNKHKSALSPAGKKRIGAVDVGSNGIRMLVCEIQKNSQLNPIYSTRAAVRLGRDVFRDGYIREPTARKALRAFLKFRKIMKRLRVRRLRSVATSAVRDSFNGREFVKYINDHSGFRLQVISGEKEGRLIHTAVSSKINLVNAVALLIDIGGGSVELTVSRFGRIEAVQTFPLGTVRLVNQTDMHLGKSKSKVIQKILSAKSAPLRRFLKKHLHGTGEFILIGTGGNIEALGDLRMKVLGKHSHSRMTLSELRAAVRILTRYTYNERISKLKLRPDRADVIIPGALALEMVMRLARARTILIPRVGLKDGVIIEVARGL
jgi:exopolyphosphatase/guanosine-5'-triphosphate,3'-diphosphate pyrophosphatase